MKSSPNWLYQVQITFDCSRSNFWTIGTAFFSQWLLLFLIKLSIFTTHILSQTILYMYIPAHCTGLVTSHMRLEYSAVGPLIFIINWWWWWWYYTLYIHHHHLDRYSASLYLSMYTNMVLAPVQVVSEVSHLQICDPQLQGNQGIILKRFPCRSIYLESWHLLFCIHHHDMMILTMSSRDPCTPVATHAGSVQPLLSLKGQASLRKAIAWLQFCWLDSASTAASDLNRSYSLGKRIKIVRAFEYHILFLWFELKCWR
jgi:hypothetical protein